MDKGRGPCRRRFPRKRLCLSRSDRFSLQVYTQWPGNATAAPAFFKILSLPLSPPFPPFPLMRLMRRCALRSFCSASFSPFLSRSFPCPFYALFRTLRSAPACVPLQSPCFSRSPCLIASLTSPFSCAFLRSPVLSCPFLYPPAFFHNLPPSSADAL